MSYITKIRLHVGLLVMPSSKKMLKLHLNTWFVNHINNEVMNSNLPNVALLKGFSRARYAVENDGASVIASFIYSNARLGNRAPRADRDRISHCTLCGESLSELHVGFSCLGIEGYRRSNTNINRFKT